MIDLMVWLLFAAALTGCAQIVIGTNKDYEITYTDKGAEASFDKSTDAISQTAQSVLQQAGYVDGKNGLNTANVQVRGNSNSSHIEIIATGPLSVNQDFAGKLLEEIASKK